MFSVPHLVVLFLVVLVLFGPHKLPELARGLGKLMAEFRKASNDFKMAFEEEMRNIERQNREAEWKKSQEEGEAKRQKELAESNTPSGAEDMSDAKILSEQSSASESHEPIEGAPIEPVPLEPVIEPVNDAVARGSNSHHLSDTTIDVPRELSDNEVPAEEASALDSSGARREEDSPSHQRAPETSDQPK